MMTKKIDKKRDQMMVFCMDDMVPQDHLLRLIDRAIDWSFIYDLVEGTYCHDNGRPSMDPVMLIKIPFIQYLYGIRSMRQTIREIEVNVAYRWFLGLDMMDPVPHFSTFGKNYTRRFKDTDLFGQIFSHILGQCMGAGLVDTSQIFVDATHVKACANGKKIKEQAVHDEALWYEDGLQKEIALDRERHGKRPLRDKDRDDPPSAGMPVVTGAGPADAARLTRRAAGPGKGNINTSSPMPCRLPVTGTDGSSGIPSIPGMSMTAVHSSLYMRR